MVLTQEYGCFYLRLLSYRMPNKPRRQQRKYHDAGEPKIKKRTGGIEEGKSIPKKAAAFF